MPFEFKTETDIYRHTESPLPISQTMKCYLFRQYLATTRILYGVQLVLSENV